MKKFATIILAILLVVMMATSVFATGGGTASVTSASGAPGAKVTVTLSLKDFAKANTMSVKIAAEEGLKLDYKNSQWVLAGDLTDIDSKNNAAWTISDDGVVDVNGNIMTLAFTVPTPEAGQEDFAYDFTCTVTASNDGKNPVTATAQGAITVVNPATDLNLDKQTLALDLNGSASATLVATLTPANASEKLVWTSSDETVATVSKGVVTGLKSGEAVITATAGSLSKTCTVTVTCSHDLEETPAKAASCQGAGNNQYFTCKACSKVYKADKTTETTVAAETLAALPHNYDETTNLCTSCGAEKPKGVLGDANGDGKVLANDAMLVLQRSVGAIGEDRLNVALCDVNGDGKLLANDAMLILQRSVGAIQKFPAEK